MTELLKNLNPQQKEAVCFDKGSLAVIAGAGSGKTNVLTKRIAWLCEEKNIHSSQIMAVTFTNKAAQEMKKRLTHLGLDSIDKMWVGTFHGLAYKMLRIHFELAGLSQNFQILDQDEQEKIIKKIFKINNWSKDQYSIKETVHYINAQKDKGLRPLAKPSFHTIEDFYQKVYQLYQDLCDQNNWVDFGELLLHTYELTRDHEEIRLKYQSKFKYILVDEFQDTNDVQYNWIELLSDKGQTIPTTVVGDMDQSIYSWRGAKMTNVQKFKDEFVSVHIIKLEQNYRSTQHILHCSNHLIQHNTNRIAKNLWTNQKGGDKVVLFEAYDEKEEAEWTVHVALSQYQKTQKWSDTAVLYRSNAQSQIVEEFFIKNNIPYIIYGGIRFFERAEIKDALAYLALFCDFNNDLMFERVLGTPSKGFGKKAIEAFRFESVHQKKTWFNLFNQSEFKQKYLSSKSNKTLETLIKNIELENANTESRLEDKMKWCIKETGLLDFYTEKDKKEKTDRVENLKELVSVAKRFCEGKKETGLKIVQDFLSSAILESDSNQKTHQDAVQLMTIHAAKGLEFKTVLSIGWDEGLFPNARSVLDKESLEEERRLAYVAMTRAEEHLFISGAVERRQYGQVNKLQASRFLKELPSDSYIWKRRPQRSKVLSPLFNQQQSSSVKPQEAFWKVGDKIIHPQLGHGQIIRVDGTQQNDRILVLFPNGEKKLFLPQLVKITKA